LDSINKQCLEFIAYDPNVADEEGEEEEDEEGSEQEEFSDDEDVSDDDDMSWKVRRSAAKCLASVITTRPDLLEELYKEVVPAIISRFKEREENVKVLNAPDFFSVNPHFSVFLAFLLAGYFCSFHRRVEADYPCQQRLNESGGRSLKAPPQ